MKSILLFALACGLALPMAAQQPAASSGVQLIVTALGKHGQPAAPIALSQVQVKQGHNQDPILQWAPFPANQRMDVAVAIDEDTTNMRTGLDDVKTFIKKLPANVAVSVVYLHTGSFGVASNFTLDHTAAAQKVRMPSGVHSSSLSPFGSVADLLHRWPRHPGLRRELIMISDGRESAGGNNANSPAVQGAIADAIAGGVVVYTIYASGGKDYAPGQIPNNVMVPQEPGTPVGTGAVGTPLGAFRSSNVGQANGSENLSLLASDTGGQAYSQGITSSERLTQYFDDIAARMASQYRLVIQPNTRKPHGMTRIEVKVHHSHAGITVPGWIYLAPQPHP
ncbi:MAG: hypothetical protein ACRD0Y_09525 [Terriglobales bacterium]